MLEPAAIHRGRGALDHLGDGAAPGGRCIDRHAGFGLATVHGHDDGIARRLIMALEDQQVAIRGQAAERAAGKGRVVAADVDQLAVVVAQRLVTLHALARQDAAVAPGHVVAVQGPHAAIPRHFLAVVNRGNPEGGHLQRHAQAERVEVAAEVVQRHRLVVRRQVVREVIAGPHLVPLLEVGREGDRAALALHEALAAALEREVEAGVHLVRREIVVEHGGRSAPDLGEQEEVRVHPFARLEPVPLPELVLDVLDGVEPEAVEAGARGEPELRIEQVVLHLRQFGAEVGQAADLAVELVDRAIDRLGAEPARGRRVRHVLRVIARVVVDDVEQHLDAAGVRGIDQLLQFRLGAEARVDGLVVVGPVAVECAVLEPAARHRDARGRLGRRAEVDLARDRRDPDRRGAEARDLVELGGESRRSRRHGNRPDCCGRRSGCWRRSRPRIDRG